MATAITMGPDGLQVPDEPILPFIEGDGIGPDIWRAAQHVFDAAVAKASDGARKVAWTEVLAGQKAFDQTGQWLPEETIESFRSHLVGIKGPLTTPVGGGIRSLNVALRQTLDLYACVRPVRWFNGVPSPVKIASRVIPARSRSVAVGRSSSGKQIFRSTQKPCRSQCFSIRSIACAELLPERALVRSQMELSLAMRLKRAEKRAVPAG